MYPGTWAKQWPDKPALVLAETGEEIVYLDELPGSSAVVKGKLRAELAGV